MDLASVPTKFPQFGKSIWNLARSAEEVFGSERLGKQGKGSCDCSAGECGCGGAYGSSGGGSRRGSCGSRRTDVAPAGSRVGRDHGCVRLGGRLGCAPCDCGRSCGQEYPDASMYGTRGKDGWWSRSDGVTNCGCSAHTCCSGAGNEGGGWALKQLSTQKLVAHRRKAFSEATRAIGEVEMLDQPVVPEAPFVNRGMYAVEGGSVDCATPIVQGEEELRCGTDVTDWLVRAVQSDWWSIHHEGSSPRSVEGRWRPGGPRDIKTATRDMHGEPPVCGGGCDWTFTLCGKCVKADVPGNIGAAAAVGAARVRAIALQLQDYGYGADDPWDLRAYAAGDRWRNSQRSVRAQGNFNLGGLPHEEARAELCKTIEGLARWWDCDRQTRGQSMFRACKPCDKPFGWRTT